MAGYEFDQAVKKNHCNFPPSYLPGLRYSSPQNYPLVLAGVDEAGRGPLAGPVVVGAVILPEFPQIVGLRDSKVIPQEQREALYVEIKEVALKYSVVVVDKNVIDSINILAATLFGMRQAIHQLGAMISMVLVDGNQYPGTGFPEKALVKGDNLSASIMAASVLAKVTRDYLMLEVHEKFPMYGFDKNKGYGSQQHLGALRKYGPCPHHRMSFEPLKSHFSEKPLIRHGG